MPKISCYSQVISLEATHMTPRGDFKPEPIRQDPIWLKHTRRHAPTSPLQAAGPKGPGSDARQGRRAAPRDETIASLG